jgi:Flp pilus assembly protein TadB
VNMWVLVAGACAGLGIALAAREILPSRPGLVLALARLAGDTGSAGQASGSGPVQALARSVAAAAPWLPVPGYDLELLGRTRESWLASKIACGLAGLISVPLLTILAAMTGHHLPWALPAGATLAAAAALFFAPDLVTRSTAAEKRADFRHALTSYLDLVSLERGAGAAPTEALEAAADLGGGWEFERIAAALGQARRQGRPPWEGLAELASRIGVSELADLADIAAVAGQEGARILDTLAARAESMRAAALATTKARSGSRSTTMVIPIALLGAGFLLLMIFPVLYRTLGAG